MLPPHRRGSLQLLCGTQLRLIIRAFDQPHHALDPLFHPWPLSWILPAKDQITILHQRMPYSAHCLRPSSPTARSECASALAALALDDLSATAELPLCVEQATPPQRFSGRAVFTQRLALASAFCSALLSSVTQDDHIYTADDLTLPWLFAAGLHPGCTPRRASIPEKAAPMKELALNHLQTGTPDG